MKRWAWILAIAVLVVLASCGGRGPQGLLVHLGYDEEGKIAPEAIVRDALGKELRRIAIEGAGFSLFALTGGYRAGVESMSGQSSIVDAEHGTARLIEPPSEDAELVRIQRGQVVGGGKQWAVLTESGTSLDYLIELSSGKVHDLRSIAAPGDLQWGQFSADEAYLLVTDYNLAWIVPTADPGKVRRLGEGERGSSPAVLSADGRQVLYIAESEEGSRELRLERIDGSGADVLVQNDSVRQGWFVPGRDEVLVLYDESLTVLSLRSRDEEKLLDLPGSSFGMARFGPGSTALLQVMSVREDDRWFHLDVKERRVRPLTELDGRTSAYPGYWPPQTALAIVADASAYMQAPGSLSIAAVDLASGEITMELELDAVRQWWPLSASDDGESLLIQVGTEEQWELWLFRAGADEPERVAEGDYVIGALSPDERWIAVSERAGGSRVADLRLVEIKGGKTVELGPGTMPVWVVP